jgi:hypothetical protein
MRKNPSYTALLRPTRRTMVGWKKNLYLLFENCSVVTFTLWYKRNLACCNERCGGVIKDKAEVLQLNHTQFPSLGISDSKKVGN